MRHVWTVICMQSVIDRDSNNLSLIEVLEQFQLVPPAGVKPTDCRMPFNMQWVTLWSRSEGEEPSKHRARDTVLAPSGKRLFRREYEVDLVGTPRNRVRRGLVGLRLPESGEYLFVTEHRTESRQSWKKASVVPIQVKVGVESGS